jgi:hypothetical protein
MSGKRIEINPLEQLAKATARRAVQGFKVPRYEFRSTKCLKCELPRLFPGGSLPMQFIYKGMRGVQGGPPIPLKVILHELPATGEDSSWSHCGQVSPKLSKQTGAPQHSWASMCPGPQCGGGGGKDHVLKDLARVRKQLMDNPDLRKSSKSPKACSSCKTTRDGLEFDCTARFEGRNGLSMAIINLVEMDPMGFDFRPGFEKEADHWWFSGVLDVSRGVQGSNYHWTALCPACVRRQAPVISQAAGIPKGAVL